MPAQPVHDPGAVGDEVVAMVRDESDLHRPLVQIGGRDSGSDAAAECPDKTGSTWRTHAPGRGSRQRRRSREPHPDLDDVFLAPTGHTTAQGNPEAKRSCIDDRCLRAARFDDVLRRNLRHLQRYHGLSLLPIFMPVVFLLLFVDVCSAARWATGSPPSSDAAPTSTSSPPECSCSPSRARRRSRPSRWPRP